MLTLSVFYLTESLRIAGVRIKHNPTVNTNDRFFCEWRKTECRTIIIATTTHGIEMWTLQKQQEQEPNMHRWKYTTVLMPPWWATYHVWQRMIAETQHDPPGQPPLESATSSMILTTLNKHHKQHVSDGNRYVLRCVGGPCEIVVNYVFRHIHTASMYIFGSNLPSSKLFRI